MRVLVVEDDEMIAEGLRFSLMSEDYEVLSAGTVQEAEKIWRSGMRPDFCLLDVMLPDGDGFSLCREIRRSSKVPVLFLTACDDEVSTVRALELGADDYITKPFRIRELLARMKAILRRTSGAEKEAPQLVTVGKNQVNLRIGKVYCGNEEVLLTAMEYRLLLIFLNHRGQVLSRGQILDQICDGAGEFVNDNTLTVYVGRLRKKLGDTEKEPLIETVRGAGYRLRQ